MAVKAEMTRNQNLVFGALEKAAAPMSAYSILDELRSEGLRAPLQIYRALEKLIDTGLVHRLESLNAFVVCAQPDCHRHELAAFAICDQCSHVSEFSDAEVESRLRNWADTENFAASRTTIEIRGMCKDCRG